ncbi:CsbD family protein [Massilia oculi]|uniref:CsbD family protein n=1 Tax=Massilia oculi TaxID=945844 RepID=A0A2S2DGS9_9BURK|nr:CsbD family protein [Massilia oculi]AWL04076.1 CsbD family protein [Massilia oculi]
MNKDQVKGKAKEVGGKVQQKVGEAVGSRQQQSEGLSNQAEGKAQKKIGDVKEIAKGNR